MRQVPIRSKHIKIKPGKNRKWQVLYSLVESHLWLPRTSYILIPLTFLQKLSYGPGMRTIALPLLSTLLGLFQSRALLHLEILALRQQLAMANQTSRKRHRFHRGQRLFWICLYRLWPGCLQTLRVFKPDTLRCQRKGFRLYWTW